MTTGRPVVVNDRYEINRRIGRGGMADVFLARDRQTNKPVAIKVLFPEHAVDPNFVERFRREARAASDLNHPNIVDVFDWGRSGTTYYIAMEYVDGRTLADILRANERLTARQAAQIASEVAAALGYAHAAGLVHRDIKPANILIGSNGAVKVADFGIARALNSPTESNLTQVGAVMGTATYFSPEQAQGAQPDPRSDLYSLGIVMYEMIAGRPPFTGENPVGIAYKQVHDYPTPLNRIVVDVPRAFEAIVAKLLTKDPNVRYSSADALREDLRRFRNDEMPVALMAASSGRPNGGTGQVPTTMAPAQRTGTATAVQRTAQQRRAAAAPARSSSSGGRTGWYAIAAFFSLIALGIGGFLLFSALAQDDDNDLEVQDYIGWELQDVLDDLSDRGLTYRQIDTETDPQYDDGIVFRTDPEAGTVVQRGFTVDVFYNPITETAPIPDVAGMSRAEAEQALADAGFVAISVAATPSDDVAVGDAIRTDPGAGTEVAFTDPITLYVSAENAPGDTETETAIVPFVIGFSEATARERITERGLEVDVIYSEVPFGSDQAGMVLDQNPYLNEELEVGDTVTITVGEEADPPPPTNPPATDPTPDPDPDPDPGPDPTEPGPDPTQPTTTTAPTTTTPTTVATTIAPTTTAGGGGPGGPGGEGDG